MKDKFESWLENKIKHEIKVYESNARNPKLSYDHHADGIYRGLIRGLNSCLSAYRFHKDKGLKA